MQPVIYVPRGPALEYAPLAANLYRGCSHGCRYCYAPAVLRQSREDFTRAPAPRPGVLAQLAKDAKRLAASGEKGPVLLCFTCDPYQPCEHEHGLTREAIRILDDWGLGVRLLTSWGSTGSSRPPRPRPGGSWRRSGRYEWLSPRRHGEHGGREAAAWRRGMRSIR